MKKRLFVFLNYIANLAINFRLSIPFGCTGHRGLLYKFQISAYKIKNIKQFMVKYCIQFTDFQYRKIIAKLLISVKVNVCAVIMLYNMILKCKLFI